MSKNLVKIGRTYIRTDLIAAVTIAEGDDEAVELNVHLIGREEPLIWSFDKRADAEKVQAEAVLSWLAAL